MKNEKLKAAEKGTGQQGIAFSNNALRAMIISPVFGAAASDACGTGRYIFCKSCWGSSGIWCFPGQPI